MKNEKINYNQKVNNDCVEIIPFTQKVYISAFKNCYTPQPAAYGKLIYWLVMTRFKDRVIASLPADYLEGNGARKIYSAIVAWSALILTQTPTTHEVERSGINKSKLLPTISTV